MSFPTSGSHHIESSSSSSLESLQVCHRFTFSEIQLATKNFDESLVIGRGGFGKVYKGTITIGENLSTTAAIKRLDSTSNQGAEEFWAEVKMLSSLRHCHLVSLFGYCNDGLEMILVYEYMSHGTLEDHLHKSQSHLPWVQRLKICIGAARGLDYLHTGTFIKHGVIHRDVKSSNILLHNSWEAKISDFGLSKMCPKNQQSTYVNTIVKGTFGYLDPDYFYTGKLTRKSDVYAFGVVLFEVLCGKRAVDRSLDEDQWGLAIWAQDSIKEGRLKQIVDSNIRRGISSRCLKVFAQLAKRCLHKHPKQRPTMAEVVVSLESVLTLQEKTNKTLQPAGMTIFSSNSVGGRGLNSLEMYFDTCGVEIQSLHRFDFEAISVAIENFSEANRISQHTSDSLYKGKLHNGRDIAVAGPFLGNTYKHNGRDIAVAGPFLGNRYKQDCMNEASILVKLEHENLAKLLGYCIKGARMFLIYDFSPYANLESLIFDPLCTTLNWDKRYKILLGVARALLYLHKLAPIRVIHSDVKPGNIILDESLDPILSSFWGARCLASNEIYCHMRMTFQTWGYMAPESVSGSFSTKNDVYSFGILVLETVTARRANEHFLKTGKTFEEYVWSNWLTGTSSNIIDAKIDADSSSLTRFIEIGLLCVDFNPAHRPTMEEVVDMLLGSSSMILPMLKMRPTIMEDWSMSRITPGMDLDYDTTEVEEFESDSNYDTIEVEESVSDFDYDTIEVKESISDLCPR